MNAHRILASVLFTMLIGVGDCPAGPPASEGTERPAATRRRQGAPSRVKPPSPTVSPENKKPAGAGSDVGEDAAVDSPASQTDAESDAVTAGGNVVSAADLSLAHVLAQRVAVDPKNPSAHLDHQLFKLLQDGPSSDHDATSALAEEDREILSTLFRGLTQFREALRTDGAVLPSEKVRPLIEVADHLRGKAELTIPVLELCKNVDAYGVYDPIAPARFAAKRPHTVIVYCEVENFSSILNERKRWETKLTQEVVLYSETGLAVGPAKPGATGITDSCRNRRHDFYCVQMVKIPPDLAVGRYVLKVTVVDQQAKRVAEQSMPIEIVAQ